MFSSCAFPPKYLKPTGFIYKVDFGTSQNQMRLGKFPEPISNQVGFETAYIN
jgi:hypothetical protein